MPRTFTPATRILTPAARRLQYDLIQELSASAVSKGMSRDEAQGQISGIISDIWISVEKTILTKLSEEGGGPVVSLRPEENELAGRKRDWNA